MSNGDERGPFRLDQERARALSAAGMPNASRFSETMEGPYRGSIQIDDVSALAPAHYVARYVYQWDVPAAVGFRSAFEIVGGDKPFTLVNLDPVVGNFDVQVFLDGVNRILVASGATDVVEPLAQLTPRTTTFRSGTSNFSGGALLEANRIAEWNLVCPPGSIVHIEGGTNVQNFGWCVVQEFPGGASRPVT